MLARLLGAELRVELAERVGSRGRLWRWADERERSEHRRCRGEAEAGGAAAEAHLEGQEDFSGPPFARKLRESRRSGDTSTTSLPPSDDAYPAEMDFRHADAILDRVRATPEGFVRTYGDVSPGAPRVAGAVLSACDDPTVPWHRIVRADGSLAKGWRQRELLEREGVPFNGERVVMRVARIPELPL